MTAHARDHSGGDKCEKRRKAQLGRGRQPVAVVIDKVEEREIRQERRGKERPGKVVQLVEEHGGGCGRAWRNGRPERRAGKRLAVEHGWRSGSARQKRRARAEAEHFSRSAIHQFFF